MNIMKSIRSIVRRLFGGQPAGGRLAFYPYGFHGDRYLLELVGWIASQVELFIETGANVGSTLAYMGRTYPGLRCLSCEPDEAAYQASREHTASLQNVGLLQATSQTFLGQLSRLEPDIFERPVFFWLDAHGYGFEWPLRFELEWITSRFTSAFILIDDFKVPGRESFGYDRYQDQECSLDYVHASLNPERTYRLFYPAYTERTSPYHPLRGWGLLLLGLESLSFPPDIEWIVEPSEIPA